MESSGEVSAATIVSSLQHLHTHIFAWLAASIAPVFGADAILNFASLSLRLSAPCKFVLMPTISSAGMAKEKLTSALPVINTASSMRCPTQFANYFFAS